MFNSRQSAKPDPGDAASGFTLVELMVALAVFGILVSVAVPGFRDFARNSCLTNTANAIVGGAGLARAEAVRQRRAVTFGAAPHPTEANRFDWQSGWSVWVDADADGQFDAGEAVVRSYDQRCPETEILSTNLALTAPLRYEPTGAASRQLDLVLCDNRDDESGRRVIVSPIGRPEVMVLPRTGSGSCAAL